MTGPLAGRDTPRREVDEAGGARDHGKRPRIRAIRPVVVNARMRNWIFVKVETDQPGLHGWGEATLEWKTSGVVGSVKDVGRLLVGEDPLRIEHLYQVMTRQYFWRAGIEGMSAISGIEQALWDIKGKWFGVPVYELLGGRVRDRVRLYNHTGGGEMKAMYETDEVGAVVDGALAVKEQGFTALKFMPVPRTEPVEGMRSVVKAERIVRAVRDAVGQDVDLMVDLHGRCQPAMAIRYCHAFEPHGLLFFEEPCPSEDLAATAQVMAAASIPIATGERLVGRAQFRELIESRACHIVQPDLSHCGGLWEARKIAAFAETYSMSVAPHNPNGPVALAAAIHFALATPNWTIQEMITDDVPWRDDVLRQAVEVEEGYAGVPTRPGLGIEVDEAAAARHPFMPEAEQRYFHPDGSVADW
ncbi:MAG: galactonate dehydratase [Acidimicrobiaceae bacterium]|nr:galactonate dehydratase [Acidimicrobiaceae bacterium]